MWLKFTIYGRKAPKKYDFLGEHFQSLEKNIIKLQYSENNIDLEGSSNDLRITVNSIYWPSPLLDEFDKIEPILNDKGSSIFGNLRIEIQDSKIFIGDFVELAFSQKEEWSKISVVHRMSRIYGLGEKNGDLEKSGRIWKFWNIDNSSFEINHDPLYKSYPIIMLTDQEIWIALILDYPGFQQWDLTKSNNIAIELESRNFILHITKASDPKSLSKKITKILGQMPLPPMWALGFHQSRWSYYPNSDALRVANLLREKNIPCDAIYLDIDYMDQYKCFTWDEENFGNLPELISNLHQLDFKVIPMIDPGIKVDLEYHIYREGADKGYFCQIEGREYQDKVWPGLCAFPDYFRHDVREWWKEKYQEFVNHGVDGFFNDMNEISTFNLRGTMPDNVAHSISQNEIKHYQVHNLYSQMMAKATYEGLESLYSPNRPFLLIRSSYLGSQKYGFIWTGDNKSDWDHLKQSISKLLNSGLSGHFASGADVGGFRDNVEAELLVRWTQLSIFYPICRNHTATGTIYQEPWVFGEEVEDICRKFINLRYKIMPYFYTWFWYAATKGVPLLRPIWMEYPDDTNCYDPKWENSQFFFGPQLIIAPILEKQSTERTVYIPHGKWYDYFTKNEYEGGQILTLKAELDEMIILVQDGAIIPEYEKVGINMSETSKSKIVYNTFGDPKKGYLYQDDGLTNSYLSGDYKLFEITKEQTLEEIDDL